MKRLSLVITIIFAVALTATSLFAQERSTSVTDQKDRAYVPDLATLMAITQLRHFKLSFAAEVENWPLAKYESDLVRKSLDMAGQFYPSVKNVEQERLIARVSDPILKAVDAAIESKDRNAFKVSFKKLTDACNSCHHQAGFSFIVIRVPTRSPYSDQVFPPGGH